MAEKHVVLDNKNGNISDNIDFLHRFYNAREVEYHSAAEKITGNLGLKKTRKEKLAELAGDLKSEGGAFDSVLENGVSGKNGYGSSGFGKDVSEEDIFDVDTDIYLSTERRKLSKRTYASVLLLFVLIPATLFIGMSLMDMEGLAAAELLDRIFGTRKYYLISLVIVIYAMIPFFMVFEGRKPQARELIVLATLSALATAGRGAFFMIPNFKPIIAVVIISGISFGAESGFLVGAVTMLVSNFLFGQGPWTPWQMLAMGMIGFVSGVLHRIGLLPAKRLTLCIYGFLVTVFIYGGIMNPAAVVMSVNEVTWQSLLAAYISGLPVDLVHATSTFLFLWLGAQPLIEKLQRMKIKYGLL